MTSEEAKESEIVSEAETNPEEKDVAIPSVKASSDILDFLNNNSTAISAEKLAARTGERVSTIQKELESLSDDGDLKADSSDGVKVYWSKNHARAGCQPGSDDDNPRVCVQPVWFADGAGAGVY